MHFFSRTVFPSIFSFSFWAYGRFPSLFSLQLLQIRRKELGNLVVFFPSQFSSLVASFPYLTPFSILTSLFFFFLQTSEISIRFWRANNLAIEPCALCKQKRSQLSRIPFTHIKNKIHPSTNGAFGQVFCFSHLTTKKINFISLIFFFPFFFFSFHILTVSCVINLAVSCNLVFLFFTLQFPIHQFLRFPFFSFLLHRISPSLRVSFSRSMLWFGSHLPDH